MKLRFIKKYIDENDPSILVIEADVFKSKHQPDPDERVLLRVPVESGYTKKELKEQASQPIVEEQIPEEIDFENLGVYNVSILYVVMNYLYRYLGIWV
jgi:hypothetical protein